MSINISVDNLSASIETLGSIKGDVTSEQLSSLTTLFSSQIWNTSDTAGTTQSIEKQMAQLEMLIEEIEAKIEELYDEQKSENENIANLLNNMNEESYQATKAADKNIKEQQDAISKATDAAYAKYMKGEISKEEIPMEIANGLKKSNGTASKALENHLTQMDHWGQSITSLSNKISTILDSINEYTAQLKTTQTSYDLMAQLKAKIPQHKERGDIQQSVAQPLFSPSQEALGNKAIDAYKTKNLGTWADGDASTALLFQGLTGSGAVVSAARKAEFDKMTPEEKSAAVEDGDFSKYTVPELFYISGMDAQQAASALGHVFRGAGVGYDEQTGALIVPQGHDATRNIYTNLVSQYKTLWGADAKIISGSENDKNQFGGADPIGWREGDTNYMFAVDRDQDGKFDGINEFLGYENGWDEITNLDTDNDGILTAKEMAAGGVSVVDADQSLTGAGTYGFNGVEESGVESIDLNSYKAMASGIKSTNINGNTRLGSFTISVGGENVKGFQTAINEKTSYAEQFYGHMESEAYTFGLDPDDVSKALTEAAQPKDYTTTEQALTDSQVDSAQSIEDTDEEKVEALQDRLNAVGKETNELLTQGEVAEAGNDEDNDDEDNDNKNDNATTGTTATTENDTINNKNKNKEETV